MTQALAIDLTTAIDLTRCRWTQKHGDITAYGTWWLAEDSGPRPCLVLLPTHHSAWHRAHPCVVLLDQAWIWSEEVGDPERAARTAFEFCTALRLDAGNPSNVIRVRAIIVDHLGDLTSMPPMPTDMRPDPGEVLGEVTVKEDGKVVREEELTA